MVFYIFISGEMGKFKQYDIPLKGKAAENGIYDFVLDDEFFSKIDSPEVQRGNINVEVQVSKRAGSFELIFDMEGTVLIPCDRCLDDMEQQILLEDVLEVRLGDNFLDDGEVVVIPENDKTINIARILYEYVVVNIPIKHHHAPGGCNEEMMLKLREHVIENVNDSDSNESEEKKETDPRWDGLKNIFENN